MMIGPSSKAITPKPNASCRVTGATIGKLLLPAGGPLAPTRRLYGHRRRPSPNDVKCRVAFTSLRFLMRNGGRILVDNLLAQGADLAFCVPGESYLAVLDALYDVRDACASSSAARKAAPRTWRRPTASSPARPGIVFVTRGPGASNAAIGIHTAQQDSTPMIMFIGQVGSDFVEREAFQEIDYRRMYGSIAKWVGADRSRRAHSRIRRARLPRRDVGSPGTGRAGAARGHARRSRDVADASAIAPSRRIRRRRRSLASARGSRRRSARW